MDLHSDQDQSNRIKSLIDTLQLTKHPEGGFYAETYRSKKKTADNESVLMTSIYFLLTSENVSNFHRISNDERGFTMEEPNRYTYVGGRCAQRTHSREGIQRCM